MWTIAPSALYGRVPPASAALYLNRWVPPARAARCISARGVIERRPRIPHPGGRLRGDHIPGDHIPGGHLPGGHLPGGHLPGSHLPGGRLSGGLPQLLDPTDASGTLSLWAARAAVSPPVCHPDAPPNGTRRATAHNNGARHPDACLFGPALPPPGDGYGHGDK